MSYDSSFEDVLDELNTIRRQNKHARRILLIVLPVAFALQAAVLAAVVALMSWVFGATVTVVGITCAAYVGAVTGWAIYKVQQRVNQIALHLTSVHDELLLVKDLLGAKRRERVSESLESIRRGGGYDE